MVSADKINYTFLKTLFILPRYTRGELIDSFPTIILWTCLDMQTSWLFINFHVY